MKKGLLCIMTALLLILPAIPAEETEEVILALDPTIEGETTALYLEKLLQGHVKVSKLAHGIPVGGHLDYADARTLAKAFEGRSSNEK